MANLLAMKVDDVSITAQSTDCSTNLEVDWTSLMMPRMTKLKICHSSTMWKQLMAWHWKNDPHY